MTCNHRPKRPIRPTPARAAFHTALRIVPLLCAAWCGQALAVDVIYQGPPGSSGLAGATPGAAGTAGATAVPAWYTLASADPANTLVVTGGAGGAGGNGANGNPGQDGGAAGAGGAGASSSATLSVIVPATGGTLAVTANGGLGGNAGQPGSGAGGGLTGAGAPGGVGGTAVANGVLTSAGTGTASGLAQGVAQANGGAGGRASGGVNSAAGGQAISNLTTVALGNGAADARATAVGGQGGAAAANGTTAGNGGNATASAGIGNPTATLSAYTQQVFATGGAGGPANLDLTDLAHATGGNGGDALATTLSGYSSGTLTLTQRATGGAGGDTVFATAGRGGNATSIINTGLGGARTVNIDSTAVGGAGGNGVGSPFSDPEAGTPGAGGNAISTVALTGNAPSTDSWNAVITANSTALAGAQGNGAFSSEGGTADATLTVAGYGRVTGHALATGTSGGMQGGYANASATVGSNYSAVATATANGGGAFFNAGAPATARADARSGWHASADAVALSGTGRFGNTEPGSATALAAVDRAPGTPGTPAGAPLAAEARAHALASFRGGEVLARSSYRDASLGASVVATASSAQPAQFYQPEAYSAASVGGEAYGPWSADAGLGMVVSYATALPDAASLGQLMAASPNVAAAFDDAQLLGAGTMGAMFFPFTSTAAYAVPFTAGSHLLLVLGLPFASTFETANFEFSVSNGATELYAGSFNTPDQAALFFTDNVVDLGVFNTNSLDLLVRFSLNGGIHGFSYVLGAGAALAPVPEAGTWLMLMLGLALLAWRAGALRGAAVPRPLQHRC